MAPYVSGYNYKNISMTNRIKKDILKFKFDLKKKMKKDELGSLKGTEFSKKLLEYLEHNYKEEQIRISDISRWINCYDWIMDMGNDAYPPGITGQELFEKVQQEWRQEEKTKKVDSTNDSDEFDTCDENEDISQDFPPSPSPPKLKLQVKIKSHQTRSSPRRVVPKSRAMKNVAGNTNGKKFKKMTCKKKRNVPYKLPPRNSKTSKCNPESVDPAQDPSPYSSNTSIFQIADIRSPPKASCKIYPSIMNPGNRALISIIPNQPDEANKINSNQSKSPSSVEIMDDFDPLSPLEGWLSPTLDKRQYPPSKKRNHLPSNNSKSMNCSEPLMSGQQNILDHQHSESESFKAMVEQIRDTYLGVPRSNSIQRVQVEMNERGKPRFVITVPHSEADRIMGSANECRVLCEMDRSLHSRLMQSDLIRTNQNDVGSGSSEKVINQNPIGSQSQPLDDLNNQPGHSSHIQPERPGIHIRNSGVTALNLENLLINVNESGHRSNLNQIPSNESNIVDDEIIAVPIVKHPNERRKQNRNEEILNQLHQIHETFEYLRKMRTFFSQAEGYRLRCLIPSLRAMYRALSREHKRIIFPDEHHQQIFGGNVQSKT